MDWGKLYPILDKYEEMIDCEEYRDNIEIMIADLMDKYKLKNEDAFLVLKDIMYKIYLKKKKEKKAK